MRRVRALTAAVAACIALASCAHNAESPVESGSSRHGQTTTSPTPSPKASPSRTPTDEAPRTPPTPRIAGTVARDLTTPWGLAFLPDGSALVAERDTARIKRIDTDGSLSTVGTVPGVRPNGEGGLLGLAVSRTFATDHLLYAYFTAGTDNRIVRMRYDGSRLGPSRTILDGIPAGFIHNGGRMVFGPDGNLYVGTGDPDRTHAQDRDSLGGKILRITPTGAPAPGNPFSGSPVWSYGHRNVQGLAFDPDGRLWASEFGQDTWDELNLIKKGHNYGWPRIEGIGHRSGYTDPLAVWHTDKASPSGLAYADGSLWMASLHGARLWRIPISGSHLAGKPTAFFTDELGRLRTVAAAPGGGLWLSTSNTDGRSTPVHRDDDDRILRLRLTR